jgi:hypothetical protein
MDWGVD